MLKVVKLGVNNSVNSDMERVGVRLMDGGWSKIKRPSTHPFVVHWSERVSASGEREIKTSASCATRVPATKARDTSQSWCFSRGGSFSLSHLSI